jgi:hypothetical protein
MQSTGKIADEREPDNTHQQVTSPSKGKKKNYDCSKDKKITLLKNLAEALDVSKRYYEQLKQKTNKKKREGQSKHWMCVTCSIFEKQTSVRCRT